MARDLSRLDPASPVQQDASMLKHVLWKFGVPLLLAVGGATYFAIPFAERLLTEWFQADVDMRAQLVFNSIEEGLEPLLATRSDLQIRRYLSRITRDRRVVAVLLCGGNGRTRPSST